MSVHVIADSAADIADIQDSRLTVVPLTVTFSDAVYRDGVDITTDRFYEMLVESDALPVTSQVTPYGFTQAIDAVRAGDPAAQIVIITVSGKLSGTNQSAEVAALEAGGKAAGIYVVDSQNVTVGEHVLVRRALDLADGGLDAAAIAAELAAERDRVRVVGLLDTLEYLRRGGRVPSATAAIGELLAIKPVVAVEDGLVVVRGKARGSKNGRNLLNREIEKAGGIGFSLPVCLAYSGTSDHLLQKYIDDSRSLWEGHIERAAIPITRVGSTIGTHVGPGAIALAFFAGSRM